MLKIDDIRKLTRTAGPAIPGPDAAPLACGLMGSLVRCDLVRETPRNLTATARAMEQQRTDIAGTDRATAAFAAWHKVVRRLREVGYIQRTEYAMAPAAGDCLPGVVLDGDMMIADPSRPVEPGALCLFRVRGDVAPRAKLFLGTMPGIAGADEIFSRMPQGLAVFYSAEPAMLLACATDDLLAANPVVAKLTRTGQRIEIGGDLLGAGARDGLTEALATLDPAPLLHPGPSVLEADAREMGAAFLN